MAVMAMTIFVLRGRKNMMGTAAVSKYQISIITSQSLASILSNFHVVSSVFITTSTVPYQLVSYRLCASLRLVAASLSSPTLVLPLANPVPPFDRASFFRVATPVSSIVSTLLSLPPVLQNGHHRRRRRSSISSTPLPNPYQEVPSSTTDSETPTSSFR